MAANKESETMATEARYAPVTMERRVRADLETTLPKPCQFFFFSFFFYSLITFELVYCLMTDL